MTLTFRRGLIAAALALGCMSAGQAQESAGEYWSREAALHPPGMTVPRQGKRRTVRVVRAAGVLRPSSDLVAEASRWIGASSRQMGVPSTLWCMDGLQVWLRRAGYRTVASRRAIDAVRLGPRLRAPQIGALAVTTRRGGNHVGVITEIESGGVVMISANHGRRVGVGFYSDRRIVAIVQPIRS